MPKTAASTAPASLADQLARDIQSGVFGAGAWLKQIDLQERYGAKRLDVRRALDHLTQKRVIEHVPNRGYHVHAIDERRQNHIRDIRAMLEVGAAADLMPQVTDAKVAQLRAMAERFEQLVLTGTLLQQYEVNLQFHETLYDMCVNRELVALIQDMRSRAVAAPATQWMTRARIEKSVREHFDIVAALQARDVKRLQKIIREHVMQTMP
ncbi:GntR family transcriptional regulator [Bordetella bronchialis]|uniref:Transcriptional regulator n=1 Tax=Bordetella bronchialis TaxID=463025 RepID=A0A193FTQ5_9BORD|nr:GntR family transcriptional regulator [Bordetella bronchialis]ANN65397.1 transcriptional regulator [Bordetella bronchialis]ANN70429.1 transcriptional regulator [Bordetella bronchialis]